MCGIAGFVGQGDRQTLKKMCDSINYRGPDAEGFYFKEGVVGLGHRRLSIIDLSEAAVQPMSNEDNKVLIVFNGEIYNYKDLKDELIKKGHQFKTKSDTEVIIHLYEEYGEKCLSRLSGMFALAIWDEKVQSLLLARDPMGKKPLYYSVRGKNIIFGSELKELLYHPLVTKKIDFDALNQYLTFEYIPAPRTIFRDIKKIQPGQYLKFQNGQTVLDYYWFQRFEPVTGISINEAVQALDKTLESAVEKRLMSDVPLGVFLSGGIDSSAVTYYLKKVSLGQVKSFSIGFEDKSFDESLYARQVAEFLGTDHYEKIFNSNDVLQTIPEIVGYLDEPLADASIVPTYMLSKFAREQVTVALGGDGGDELFAGYPTFQAEKIYHYYNLLPGAVKNTFRGAFNTLPTSLNNYSLDYKLKKFTQDQEKDICRRHLMWLSSFGVLKNDILTKEAQEQIDQKIFWEWVDDYTKKIEAEEPNKNLLIYQRGYLSEGVLVKVDRASMRNSLEVRAPLLDKDVVELVNRMPYSYKVKGWTTKNIFKELLKNKLPSNIINRPKKGFGIPIGMWFRTELKDFLIESLKAEKLKRKGIFNAEAVDQLIDEHLCGKKDNRKKLWTLLIFQKWMDNFINN